MTGTGILLLLLANLGGLHLSALIRDHSDVQRAGTKRAGLGPEVCPADVRVCATLRGGCPWPWGCARGAMGGARWGDRSRCPCFWTPAPLGVAP